MLSHQASCRGGSASDGFTLVELIVAMMIIGTVLLGLLGLQVSALTTTTSAKQRQQATALGNEVMEGLRALPYKDLIAGLSPAAVTADPNITSGNFKPAVNTAIDEVVVQRTSNIEGLEPLSGDDGTNITTFTSAGADFKARSYVTREVSASPGEPLWLSVVVSWTSTITDGETKQQLFRSQVYSPAGCLDLADHPYSGPCQPFLYGDASIGGGRVSVVGPTASSPAVAGASVDAIALSLAAGSAGVAAEQSTSVRTRATTGGATTNVGTTVVEARGQKTATTLADDDQSQASQVLASDSASLTQADASALGAAGTYTTVTLSPQDSDAATLLSAVSPTGTECAQPVMGYAVGQPCSNTTVTDAGTARGQIDFTTATLGLDLPPFDVFTAEASGAPSIARTGRFVTTPGNGICAAVSGPGCVGAKAARSLGATTVGGLPAGDEDGLASSLTEGLIRVTGYQDEVTSEHGPATAAVGLVASRSGTLSYWNGSGYTNLVVGEYTDVSISLPALVARYDVPSDNEEEDGEEDGGEASLVPSLRVEVAGTLSVTPFVENVVWSTDCVETCVKEGTMPSVSATLTYTLWFDNTGEVTVLDTFSIVVDLGTTKAVTSYKAAP